MGAHENRAGWIAYLLIAPAFLIIVITVLYPIGNVLYSSLTLSSGRLGLGNYRQIFTDPQMRASLLYTLYICVATVVLAIAVSYALALYLRFSHSAFSRAIGKLYIFPRFIPGLVAVNGMIIIIRDAGFLNRLSRLFGMNFKPGLMYNDKGIILMNLWFNIPFATMLILSSLSAIPDSTVEAARDVGASTLRLVWRMILPLTTKDVIIAAMFVFMGNVGSFTTPYLMGGNSPQMLGVVLYKLYNSQQYTMSAALSVLMFLICLVSAVLYIYSNMREKAWEKQG